MTDDRYYYPWSKWIVLAVLILGGTFRFVGIDWDQGQHLHPDERFLTMVESALQWPASLAEYLDEGTSQLNPRNVGYSFFVYGSLPTTLVKAVAVASGLEGYDQVYLVGRSISALFDLFTLLFLFPIARRLYKDDRIALLAVLLYACAVLPIQHSHFFVVDTFASFFATATVYCLILVQVHNRFRDYLFTGLCFGLALACKLSVFTLVLVLLVLVASRWYLKYQNLEGDSATSGVDRSVSKLLLFAVAAFIAFRILQPDAFQGVLLPSERWLENVDEARRLVSGDVDFPPGHQWTDRAVLWFPWWNMVVWGLGLPLGLAAWTGWGAAAWRLVRFRDFTSLIPVVWVAILFLHQGSQWVKALRYFLPIYPILILLAAWVLIKLSDRIAATSRELIINPARVARLLPVLVAVATFLWASAFTNIYRQDHSRVQASRWIYENIPEGSVLAREHWDDPLPLAIDSLAPDELYRTVEMQWYLEDTEEKLNNALDWFETADYIVLSSNRLYGSIPRLPRRYPMTSDYYRALFDGRLGWRKVADFVSYPSLLGLTFQDQGAEESFTVYDHPRVQIFQKTEQYSQRLGERLLGGRDWDTFVRLTPKQATRTRHGLLLPPERWKKIRSSTSWDSSLDDSGLSNRLPLLIWMVELQVLGIIAFPIVFFVFVGLPDRGYAFSKIAGLLFSAWLVWLGASLDLFEFSQWAILLTWGLLSAAGLVLMWKQWSLISEFLRGQKNLILFEESLFWGLFLLFVLIRWLNSDLWHPYLGGEKPMDLAYFSAVVRTSSFPPYDPWFAGGYLNYYYFGFVLWAMLTKASGILPEVAYNLSLASLFTLVSSGVFGVMAGLVKRTNKVLGMQGITFAVGGTLTVAVVGNLGFLKMFLQRFSSLSPLDYQSGFPGMASLVETVHGILLWLKGAESLSFRPESWFWDPSRIISHPTTEAGPINEFPWFTYLFGDLHAHAMALPIGLMVLGLVISQALSQRSDAQSSRSYVFAGTAAALSLGSLWATNPWDLPAYAVVSLLTILSMIRGGEWALGTFIRWCLIMGSAYLLFLPYHFWNAPAYGAFEFWRGSRTTLSDFLYIHGLFLFPIITVFVLDFCSGSPANSIHRQIRLWGRWWYRIVRVVRLSQRIQSPSLAFRIALGSFGAGLVIGILLLLIGLVLQGLLVLLLLGAVTLLSRVSTDRSLGIVILFLVVGTALALLVEFLVLRGDVGRMNTVFKFYFQVWVFWGIAAATSLWLIWSQRVSGTMTLGRRWWMSYAILLLIALAYPLVATPARLQNRIEGSTARTLDGTSFMDRAFLEVQGESFALKWDREAIEWIRDHAEGVPVVAEANTHPVLYGWGNRFSVYAGTASIVGWDWHQRQQRGAVPLEMVSTRIEDIKRLYNTMDLAETRKLLSRYEIDYVVVGGLERALFDPAGLEKFRSSDIDLWGKVYENPEVRIFRVRKSLRKEQ